MKPAKRPRESDTAAQETNDKTSKKKAKKLKAENGDAVPAPAVADADAQKKGEKKDKKAKKGGESKEGDVKKEEGKGGDAKQKQADKASLHEFPSGLKVVDHKVGEGPQAKSGMKVSLRYIGKLENGNVFDSNTKGKPVRHLRYFYLRKTHVVLSTHSSRSGWGLVR